MPELFNLLILGLVYGFTVCSLSCMPYFAPYILGSGNGFADGLSSSLAFVMGKICTYTVLGGIAAMLGLSMPFHRSHNVLMGIVMILVALTLPFAGREGCRQRCRGICTKGSMFTLGIISSAMPCPPLVAVFLLAAKSGSIAAGLSYGFCYGLGLVLSPMLILGGGFALLSQKIKHEARGFAPYMQGLAMLVMIVMAANIMTA